MDADTSSPSFVAFFTKTQNTLKRGNQTILHSKSSMAGWPPPLCSSNDFSGSVALGGQGWGRLWNDSAGSGASGGVLTTQRCACEATHQAKYHNLYTSCICFACIIFTLKKLTSVGV